MHIPGFDIHFQGIFRALEGILVTKCLFLIFDIHDLADFVDVKFSNSPRNFVDLKSAFRQLGEPCLQSGDLLCQDVPVQRSLMINIHIVILQKMRDVTRNKGVQLLTENREIWEKTDRIPKMSVYIVYTIDNKKGTVFRRRTGLSVRKMFPFRLDMVAL